MSQPRSISPSSLHGLLPATAEASLLDVRTPAEFQGKRAAGAVNLPLDEITPEKLAINPPCSKEAPVYLLCERGGRAALAAERFQTAGFRNVSVVEGGTQAWVAAGLPVVLGERRTISIERQVRIGAGSFVLLGVILGLLVSPAFFGLSAFVGAGLIFAGVTDWCGMGLLLASAPWNR